VAGNLQKPLKNVRVLDEIAVELSEEDSIALAMELCPPGHAIEIHADYCDLEDCTCIPRRIVKPVISS